MAALPASTHHRLKCIYALVKHLGAGHLMKIVPGNLIVELVMGTKEVNDRARVMAYHVLAAIGERAQELEVSVRAERPVFGCLWALLTKRYMHKYNRRLAKQAAGSPWKSISPSLLRGWPGSRLT